MKLHAVNWQGPVGEALDDPVLTRCCNAEGLRHRRADHAERMIPRSAEGASDSGKKTGAVVENLRSLAMHYLRCMGDGGSEIFADGLQTQTHAEYGKSPGNSEAEGARKSWYRAGISGAGPKHHRIVCADEGGLQTIVVIKDDAHSGSGHREQMHDVVGKRIEVVDEE